MMNLQMQSNIIRIKLANLTNRCSNDDIDYWVSEAANIIGVKDKVNTNDPKVVLIYMLNKILKYKLSNN